MSLLMSRRDLAFLLYEWLDAEALASLPRYAEHNRETFDAVLDTSERIAADLFAPHAARGDREEPHFDGERVTLIPDVEPAVRAFADAGLIAAGHDEALGGTPADIFYHLVTTRQEYDDSVFQREDARQQERRLQQLQRQAKTLGFSLDKEHANSLSVDEVPEGVSVSYMRPSDDNPLSFEKCHTVYHKEQIETMLRAAQERRGKGVTAETTG